MTYTPEFKESFRKLTDKLDDIDIARLLKIETRDVKRIRKQLEKEMIDESL